MSAELAPLTTFKIGGNARTLLRISTDAELVAMLQQLRIESLSFAVLGGGANILVPDEGVDGTVLKIEISGIKREYVDTAHVRLVVGAGVMWDDVVAYTAREGLWGIENLAGIPGTVGGAVVQNIGAYGAELADVFDYADVFNMTTGKLLRLFAKDVRFAYRDSRFKHERTLIVMRAAFVLQGALAGKPNLGYKDLQQAGEREVSLTSPSEIATAVRSIRAQKFPDLTQEGTAGSFFKNPVVSGQRAEELTHQFPDLPYFPQPSGSTKLSLAWLLDRALSLKGLTHGGARLFERQPLVIVARPDTSAYDVEMLAQEVERRVFAATGIAIEREVETFAARLLA